MTILIAPDSFKDALPAAAASEAIRRGVLAALPSANVQCCPMADGGEGTAEVLAWHLSGTMVKTQVSDPLMRPVAAQYFSFGKKAFVEMAEASGLQRLTASERNPLITSSFGTGELLGHALRSGATEYYLAVGGSATNDAGMGMATALGWRFLDKNGDALSPIGEHLGRVETIVPPNPDISGQVPQSKIRNLKLLTDVTNPLFGPNGAAFFYAPQKGADAAAVKLLDDGLRHFAAVVERSLGHDFSQVPGAGAAGGLGFGAMAFLGAEVLNGAEALMQLIGFEAFVKKTDLIITGEGRLDGQTSQGKLIGAICRKAKQHGVPVVAICGEVSATEAALKALGLTSAVQIKQVGEGVEASISRTAEALEYLSHNVLNTMLLRQA